jgi:hypothetical protein
MNKTEMIERINKINNKAAAHRKEQVEIRNEMVAAIHEMVTEMGGKVEVDYDGDEPFSISYDGGRHPEYASNLYADVYSVKATMVKSWESEEEKKSFSVEIEETDDYKENRMNYDDVEQVFDFVCEKYENWVADI